MRRGPHKMPSRAGRVFETSALHEMNEIIMKIEICESWTTTLGTVSQ